MLLVRNFILNNEIPRLGYLLPESKNLDPESANYKTAGNADWLNEYSDHMEVRTLSC
jgi:hypothetical protein